MISFFCIRRKGIRPSKWKALALSAGMLSSNLRGGYVIAKQCVIYKFYTVIMFLIIGSNVHELVLRTHFLLQGLAGGECPIV